MRFPSQLDMVWNASTGRSLRNIPKPLLNRSLQCEGGAALLLAPSGCPTSRLDRLHYLSDVRTPR